MLPPMDEEEVINIPIAGRMPPWREAKEAKPVLDVESDIEYFWKKKNEADKTEAVEELKSNMKRLRVSVLTGSRRSESGVNELVKLLKAAPTEDIAKEVLGYAVDSFPEILPTFRPVKTNKHLSELRRRAFRARALPSFRFKSSIIRNPARIPAQGALL